VDCVLVKMQELGVPRTVQNYLDFAYLGERTFASLEGEERAEIERLIEDGELVATESNFRN
jgi:hypothetical protein